MSLADTVPGAGVSFGIAREAVRRAAMMWRTGPVTRDHVLAGHRDAPVLTGPGGIAR
jgi:hypothetical protein